MSFQWDLYHGEKGSPQDQQIARLTAANAKLRTALERAIMDMHGSLKAFGYELRSVIGNTNVALIEHHIAEARRALADADTGEGRGEGWIACSERMPSNDTGYWVLGWNGREVAPIHWDLNEHAKKPTPRWTKNDWSVYRGDPITHWRPLPAPPRTDDEKEGR